MAAFKRVDPSFPERIMRMSEDSVRTRNKAVRISTILESLSITVTSVSFALIPWLACIFLAVKGFDIAAGIAGLAGFLTAGAQVISAIRGNKS
jgi:ABC-type multidrug transport system fused ATPase/permease subunit